MFFETLQTVTPAILITLRNFLTTQIRFRSLLIIPRPTRFLMMMHVVIMQMSSSGYPFLNDNPVHVTFRMLTLYNTEDNQRQNYRSGKNRGVNRFFHLDRTTTKVESVSNVLQRYLETFYRRNCEDGKSRRDSK